MSMALNEKVIVYDIKGVPMEFLVTGIGSDVFMPVAGLSANNADNVAVLTTSVQEVNSYLMGFDGTNWDRLRSDGNNADAVTVSTLGILNNNSFNLLFNGSTYDRERNNTEETLLASAARTAAVTSADFTNYNAKGIHVITDISALTATGQITVTLQGKDPISGNYYDLLIGPTLVATGTSILKLYPGITASANASASDILPRVFRVSVAVANAVSITYSIAGVLVV